MRVIGAGFGRTGTTSLKEALEALGFGPCYHMFEVFEHPEHAEIWRAAWRGAKMDWDALLGDYEATVDWPACTFYAELMEEYPDAKVLLSVRDPERWYESTRNTIYELNKTIIGSRLSRAVFAVVGIFMPGPMRIVPMVDEILWRGTFDGRLEDRRHAIEVFDRHNEEVTRRVPPDRLLVYEVREGWGPLCEFLGVEEPDEPFPRLNDSAEMRRRILMLRAIRITTPVLAAAGAFAALAFLVRRARGFLGFRF